ncbi:MAG: DHH family phosphoesterase [Bacteroidales bacterium]|nr:DHH family phosphoesterase [Bacteroidales bacterium]MCF8388201.1 DHH family phosphoesterase [Bacteroidales bacterium]MCF8399022.1 DHH family phosphoesterase [Bacteroidales bacterium]
MEQFDFHKARERVKQAKRIAICSHTNPDGDAIGSSLGLYHALKTIHNGEIRILIPNDFPAFLKWLPAAEEIVICEESKQEAGEIILGADLIFCLDFNDISRTEQCSEALQKTGAEKILIDHHPNPKQQFDLLYSTTSTSSTAELVYGFIKSFGLPSMLNSESAQSIYTGIMTDTGSFSYLCNYESTYLAVADLIKAGVDAEQLHRLVYDTYSADRLRLLGFCLSERLKILKEYHTAYIYLYQKDLERFNYQVGDIEGVVNYPLSIEEIHFALLFREQDGKVRISMRSKGSFPVNDFARKHFIGGGHKNAAGADSLLSLDKSLEKFEQLLPQYKMELSV